ncbi:AEC family transporter [Roseospira visakhapatnamensis]|uniref:AEC family transporter n=1 Tax=Roseospira visakhapatnamensis TaxID=390880 RepID=A0A7W6WAF6_9PROT|nr:AEC family transporter [Roseospira visakhapatnamensis]MBB4266914.1 hypothetical protein [Roseospira visakhapatnamensis]
MISALFAVIAPVFLIAGIGYTWVRLGWPFDTDMVARLSTTVGVPFLVLHVMTRVDLAGAALATMALSAVLAVLIMGAAGLVLLRLARLPLPPYLPALTFGNAGNMGLPLCLFAFGEPGLALAVAFFVVTAILNFTLGVAVASGRFALRALARTPVIWALAVALGLKATDIPLPAFLANTVQLLAGFTIPMMLLALGAALANLRPGGLTRAAALSAFKLGVGLGAGLLVVWALGLTGAVRGVVLIEAAMPVAVFNYLFAERYGNRPEEVAGMVLISSLMILGLLPGILWLAWDGMPPPL